MIYKHLPIIFSFETVKTPHIFEWLLPISVLKFDGESYS